jgi:hypothetical protein
MTNGQAKVRALRALKRLHQVRQVTALQERSRVSEAISVLQRQIEDMHRLIEELREARERLWRERPIEMNRIVLLKLTGADAQVRRRQLDAVATLDHLREAVAQRQSEVVEINSCVARAVRKQENVAYVLAGLRRQRMARQAAQEESDTQEQFYARQ